MRDPLPAPLLLAKSTVPLANALSLRTLPFHTHEILPSFALYNILHIYIAPTISTRLFPQTYPSFPRRTKDNWNIHLVSLLQSTFISTLALSVMYLDKERRRMGPVQRVWGYTGATGMVQGFSAGYFLWDLGVCMADVGAHGWGALTHAAAALTVSLLGFVCPLQSTPPHSQPLISNPDSKADERSDYVSSVHFVITTASPSSSTSSPPPSSTSTGSSINCT